MTMHDGITRQSDRFKKVVASRNTSSYKVVQPGQLVVGFPIDEGVIYVQDFDEPGIMSPAYNVWNIDSAKVLPGYLNAALHSPQSMSYYRAKLRGTTARRRTITDANLLALRIPLPDINEQHQIVESLNSIQNDIDSCDSQLDIISCLIKSRFVERFGNRASGEIVALRDCCSSIVGGKTPSMKHPEYYGGGIPFIKSGDVIGDRVFGGALSLSDVALEHASVKMIPAGSVLVVTRSARLRKEIHCAVCASDVAINQDIKAFTPLPEFTSDYLLWAIRSHEPDLLKTVRSVSTSGMDLGTLFGIGIRKPPSRSNNSSRPSCSRPTNCDLSSWWL